MTQQSMPMTAEAEEGKGVPCFCGHSGCTETNGACSSSKNWSTMPQTLCFKPKTLTLVLWKKIVSITDNFSVAWSSGNKKHLSSHKTSKWHRHSLLNNFLGENKHRFLNLIHYMIRLCLTSKLISKNTYPKKNGTRIIRNLIYKQTCLQS